MADVDVTEIVIHMLSMKGSPVVLEEDAHSAQHTLPWSVRRTTRRGVVTTTQNLIVERVQPVAAQPALARWFDSNDRYVEWLVEKIGASCGTVGRIMDFPGGASSVVMTQKAGCVAAKGRDLDGSVTLNKADEILNPDYIRDALKACVAEGDVTTAGVTIRTAGNRRRSDVVAFLLVKIHGCHQLPQLQLVCSKMRGLGGVLMRLMQNACKELGFEHIVLEVANPVLSECPEPRVYGDGRASAAGLIANYERAGYVEDPSLALESKCFDPTHPYVTMKLALNPVVAEEEEVKEESGAGRRARVSSGRATKQPRRSARVMRSAIAVKDGRAYVSNGETWVHVPEMLG